MSEQAAAGGSTALDIGRIMELLPHRYPFLVIDRIKEMRGDEYGVGIKNVTINEPQFTGHFPSRPVFPGVLLIEGMAQTAGVMCLAAGEDTASLVYFMSIDKAKFRRPVVPGDVVEHRMTRLQRRGKVWRFRGESYVGEQLVAEAEVTAMIAKG